MFSTWLLFRGNLGQNRERDKHIKERASRLHYPEGDMARLVTHDEEDGPRAHDATGEVKEKERSFGDTPRATTRCSFVVRVGYCRDHVYYQHPGKVERHRDEAQQIG